MVVDGGTYLSLTDPNQLFNVMKSIQVIITKLKLNKSRKAILERKARTSAADKNKGKFTEADVNLAGVD